MLAANNLLKPSDGRPVAVPTQDMVLGSYYLTMEKDGEKGEGKIFRDVNEALMAYNEGDVSIHAKIKVRITRDIGDKRVSQIIDCTVGRLIFNENIPQNLGYVDRTDSKHQFDLEIAFLVGKKQLGQIIDRCIKIRSRQQALNILQRLPLPLRFAMPSFQRKRRTSLQQPMQKLQKSTTNMHTVISPQQKSPSGLSKSGTVQPMTLPPLCKTVWIVTTQSS